MKLIPLHERLSSPASRRVVRGDHAVCLAISLRARVQVNDFRPAPLFCSNTASYNRPRTHRNPLQPVHTEDVRVSARTCSAATKCGRFLKRKHARLAEATFSPELDKLDKPINGDSPVLIFSHLSITFLCKRGCVWLSSCAA